MSGEHGHSAEEIAARIGAPMSSNMIRDMIYGAIDGAVTTFAIVASVAGAGLSPLIVVALGLANVLADGFSMAAGNYSGIKADADNAARLREVERRHIRDHPEGEKEELRQILAGKGLSGKVLDAATDAISADEGAWVEMMMVDEYGVSPAEPRPLRAATVTFVAFLVAGGIPLIPFLIGFEDAFTISSVLVAVVFFGIGTLKSVWSLQSWWRSGLETLLIGGAAAAIAYVVGTMFAGH